MNRRGSWATLERPSPRGQAPEICLTWPNRQRSVSPRRVSPQWCGGWSKGDLVAARAAVVVVPVALFYGGLVQLLAGTWEFRRGNTFGALAFSSDGGGFWLPYGLLSLLLLPVLRLPVRHQALAIFYVVWAVFSLYLLLAALRTTAVSAGFVLVFFATLSILAAALYAGDNSALFKIGGYVGIFAGGVAWYGSLAAVTNSVSRRSVLPVFPL